MDFLVLEKRIIEIKKQVELIGGKIVKEELGEVVTDKQIKEVEKEYGIQIPTSFKKVLTEFSSESDFFGGCRMTLEFQKS